MKDILTKRNGKSFVTFDDGKYFIEGVEYTDDIDLLLEAIETVCSIEYKDLYNTNLYPNKRTYWMAHFNYQWSGGGLISWQNPAEIWTEELCRRGELHCDSCNGKMEMYYRPMCFNCYSPQPEEDGSLNLIEVIKHLAIKLDWNYNVVWKWVCDNYEFSNDSYIKLRKPTEHTGNEIDYWAAINEHFNTPTHLFYVSW